VTNQKVEWARGRWGPSGPVGTIGPARGKYCRARKLEYALAAACLHANSLDRSHDGNLPNWFTSTLKMETLNCSKVAVLTTKPQNGVGLVDHNVYFEPNNLLSCPGTRRVL
jgi:hypothetical protein